MMVGDFQRFILHTDLTDHTDSFTTRFLNTNRTNYTNILLHTDLTDHTDSCSQRCAHGFWTRLARIKRIIYCTRISRISRITRILFRSVALTVFEHEIRRRPTDRREVIKRIKRIFYCTRISRITRIFYNEILNTNSTNYTNIIFHTDLTDLCLRQFLIMGFLHL